MKTFKLITLFLCLFSYSLAGLAKTLVITDIDDTIKKANSMGGIGGLIHFFKKKPFEETRDLFNEIKNNEINQGNKIGYYYVSAAPSFSFDGVEWIKKNNFPDGPVILKTRENGGETYEYKSRTIKGIIEAESKIDPDLKIIFFGDNSQHDAQVYYDLRKAMNLNASIYIRDVSTEATYFDVKLPVMRLDNVNYFFSEKEFEDYPEFAFMTNKLKNLIDKNYSNRSIIPLYTYDTMVVRLKEICQRQFVVVTKEIEINCKTEARIETDIYWADYYTRY